MCGSKKSDLYKVKSYLNCQLYNRLGLCIKIEAKIKPVQSRLSTACGLRDLASKQKKTKVRDTMVEISAQNKTLTQEFAKTQEKAPVESHNQDGFLLLIHDHRDLTHLFDELFKSHDYNQKKLFMNTICSDLAIHCSIEEMMVYPLIRDLLEDKEADDSEREHFQMRKLIDKIKDLHPHEKEFDSIAQKMNKELQEHVQKEENEIFARLKGKFNQNQLNKLHELLTLGKKVAPDSPYDKNPERWFKGHLKDQFEELRRSF
jgi:hemerythrin superfamily protein